MKAIIKTFIIILFSGISFLYTDNLSAYICSLIIGFGFTILWELEEKDYE